MVSILFLAFTALAGAIGLAAGTVALVAGKRRAHAGALVALAAAGSSLLLGIAGTVLGLTSAFGTVSRVNPAQKSEMLAHGIQAAMRSTAVGVVACVVVGTLGVLGLARAGRLAAEPPRDQ